jgi:hypothetical protein
MKKLSQAGNNKSVNTGKRAVNRLNESSESCQEK